MKKNFGFSLVEVIVAVSIAIFSILAVWRVYTFFVKLSLSNPALFQASFLAEEGVEAVKFMRDASWSSNIEPFTSGTLSFNGLGWEITDTPELIDGKFDRRVVLGRVSRDNFGNIVEVGGVLDEGTKKVTVTVSWQKDGSTTTKEITTYVTNIFKN